MKGGHRCILLCSTRSRTLLQSLMELRLLKERVNVTQSPDVRSISLPCRAPHALVALTDK